MRYVAVLFGLIAVLAFVGCGSDDPASAVSEEGINAPAGKLVASATKAGGYRGSHAMMAIHRAAMDAFNDHDLDRQQSYYTEDIFFESIAAPPSASGKEEFRPWMEAFYTAFPDVQATVLNRKTSGNMLVSEEIYTGTHLGNFGGIPGTGQVVQAPVLNIAEFEGDKVKHQSHYWDMVTLMVQMGVMPASEQLSLEPSFELPDPEPTGLSPLQADAALITRWNTHDMAHWSTMLHADAVLKYNTAGMLPLNREQGVGLNELFALSNSTLKGEIVRQIDLGDGWVATESVWSGVQDGPYFGIPATDLPVTTRAASLGHYDADGLVTSFHFYFDNLGVLMQIGAVPAP